MKNYLKVLSKSEISILVKIGQLPSSLFKTQNTRIASTTARHKLSCNDVNGGRIRAKRF